MKNTMPTDTKQGAHTPGPWKAQNALFEDGPKNQIVTGDLRATIANMSTDPSVRHQFEANAHLIAAAPELLEALKAMHKHFITESFHVGDPEETLERLSMAAIKAATLTPSQEA